MYIFRLAPIGTEVSKDWTDSEAITFLSLNDPDYFDAPDWDPGISASTGYSSGTQVGRNQYIYISLTNTNKDDPLYNYVGRTPEPTKDSTMGYGQNSWLKYRLSNRFLCFNRLQPGYSWGTQGSIDTTVKFRQTMQDPSFFGAGGDTVEPQLYLILTGLVGSNATITFHGVNDVIRTETIALVDTNFVFDWILNHELPGIAKDTVIRKFSLSEGISKIQVKVEPPEISGGRAGIGGFYIGKATRAGITQQDNLSFGMQDYSSVTIDDWGYITTSKRRVAKKIDAEIAVATSQSDSVFRLVQHIRATPSFFLFTNNLDAVTTVGSVITGLTGLLGTVKASTTDKLTTKATKLSISVEGIPTEFNDKMLRWPVSICGMPPLPVVPPVVVDPIDPDVPPISTEPVTGVELSKETLKAIVNKSYFLFATVLPLNAGNRKVTWTSSEPTVAIVSSDGIVTAKAVGTTTITVTTVETHTVGTTKVGYTDTCLVTVSFGGTVNDDDFIFEFLWADDNIFIFDKVLKPFGDSDVPVQGVELSINPSYTIRAGTSYFVTATVLPSNAGNKDVVWVSSDPLTVTVGLTGTFTAIKEGTATLTATTVEGGFTASCSIIVTPAIVIEGKVTGVAFSQPTFTTPMGQTLNLIPYVIVSPANALNKTVKISLPGNSVGKIDALNIFTPVAPGTVTATAKTIDGNFTATCQVTVTPLTVPVTAYNITLTIASMLMTNTLYLGGLRSVITPTNATNKAITWTSSDSTKALVDITGRVYPKAVGTVTITGTTVDGNFLDTCIVTIK